MFDRKLARQLGDGTVEALKDLAEKHGLSVSFKGGRYSASGCKITVEFSKINDDGTVETSEMVSLRRDYPDLVGKSFKSVGNTYEIVGYKPRSPKYPFIGKNSNGTMYTFGKATVLNGLVLED